MVCALFGFSTVEDYYTAASTTTYIPSIRTHTLLLVAQDDPFLGRMPLQVRMRNLCKFAVGAGNQLVCPGLGCCGTVNDHHADCADIMLPQ